MNAKSSFLAFTSRRKLNGEIRIYCDIFNSNLDKIKEQIKHIVYEAIKRAGDYLIGTLKNDQYMLPNLLAIFPCFLVLPKKTIRT